LLTLLMGLFGGLQFLVNETASDEQVSVAPPAATAADAAPAERVVERVVYVPVKKSETTQLTDANAGPPSVERLNDAAAAQALSGLDSTNGVPAPAVAQLSEASTAVAEAGSADESAPADDRQPTSMGLLAVVTPVPVAPVAAPVRSAPVVARAVAPQPVAESDEDEAVADSDLPAEDAGEEAVADAPAEEEDRHEEVAQVQVIDTTIEPDQSTRTVLYRVPVRAEAESPQAAAPAATDEPTAPDDAAMAEDPGAAPADDATVDAAEAEQVDDEIGEASGDVAASVAGGEADAPAAEDEASDESPVPADEDGDAAAASDEAPADDDREAGAPDEPRDVPQLSVTVLATSNGGFVSEDGSGQ
jgi:nicotinate-nucleotide--dimethylbenzimidazole phosphoribosyltransferase